MWTLEVRRMLAGCRTVLGTHLPGFVLSAGRPRQPHSKTAGIPASGRSCGFFLLFHE